MKDPTARIIELFSSIQGEGLWVGKPQVFVRFHGCKLKCAYCDTPLTHKTIHESRIEYPPYSRKFEKHSLEFGAQELNEEIKRFGISSLALTGGEPLEQADFIASWLEGSRSHYEVLLETSGVEIDALKKVLPWISLISMDLKIPSATGENPLWEVHQQFIHAAGECSLYAKVVYDEKMTDGERKELTFLMKRHQSLMLIFQPVSPLQKRDLPTCLALFHSFAESFPQRVRLIPQVHKFLSIL